MNRKMITAAVAVLLGGTLAVGCGPNSSGGPGKGTPTPASTTPSKGTQAQQKACVDALVDQMLRDQGYSEQPAECDPITDNATNAQLTQEAVNKYYESIGWNE